MKETEDNLGLEWKEECAPISDEAWNYVFLDKPDPRVLHYKKSLAFKL